jgi:hypothetical protein
MKVGDLVKINCSGRDQTKVWSENCGVIVCFKSFEKGKNPQPIVLIDGKLRLYGTSALQVVNESG